MFEYDICFCGNYESCPRQSNCKRAELNKHTKPGMVYTSSLFYKKDEKCEYYYPIVTEANE